MSLLAPLGLVGLLLVPIIVAIHMWRVRHRRYDLSSTLLWSRVLSETPLRRPRQLPTRYILLALQLAALCCGAVALARPSLADTGRHRRLVVAVDTSLAMGATDVRPSRLARAESAVRVLIDGLGRNDSMTLVDAGTTPRVLAASGDPATLRRALSSLSQGYGPSSLASDGPLLAGLLSANGRQAQGYLFAPLGAPLDALRAAAPGLAIHTVGTRGDDRGVAALSVACTQVGAKPRCEAYARLVNTAASGVTTRLTADVDGQTLTQEVALPADSAVPIQLSLPADARTVSLRLDGRDTLPADDAAWAVAPLPVRRTVLLVTDDATTALAQALRDIPNLTLSSVAPDAYNSGSPPRVDLTVLDGTDDSIQPPGSVLAINPTGTWLGAPSGTQQAPGVTSLRSGDALLRGVDLSSLVVQSATRVRLPGWATSDVEGDQGPLIYSGIMGGRRAAVLLFDPRVTASANASNLATLLAFPALLRDAVETLAPAPPSAAPSGAVAAAPVVRQGAVMLQPSVGRALPLVSAGDLAALPALRPGLYSIGGAAGGGASLAVNAVVPDDPAAPPPAPPAPAPSAPALVAPSSLMPWEGWAIVAVLALVALSGEWWYYVRRT